MAITQIVLAPSLAQAKTYIGVTGLNQNRCLMIRPTVDDAATLAGVQDMCVHVTKGWEELPHSPGRVAVHQRLAIADSVGRITLTVRTGKFQA